MPALGPDGHALPARTCRQAADIRRPQPSCSWLLLLLLLLWLGLVLVFVFVLLQIGRPRQRRRGKRFTTSQLGKRKANLPGEVHLRDFDGASGLSRQSTELELPHSNGGGGAGARAHQPLHDEVSLPGTDDGEPTASVERI